MSLQQGLLPWAARLGASSTPGPRPARWSRGAARLVRPGQSAAHACPLAAMRVLAAGTRAFPRPAGSGCGIFRGRLECRQGTLEVGGFLATPFT